MAIPGSGYCLCLPFAAHGQASAANSAFSTLGTMSPLPSSCSCQATLFQQREKQLSQEEREQGEEHPSGPQTSHLCKSPRPPTSTMLGTSATHGLWGDTPEPSCSRGGKEEGPAAENCPRSRGKFTSFQDMTCVPVENTLGRAMGLFVKSCCSHQMYTDHHQNVNQLPPLQ